MNNSLKEPEGRNTLPRVLFVLHEASRTGAPICVLRLLTWLKGKQAVDCDVLILTHGILDDAFREVATHVYWQESDWRPGHIFGRALRKGARSLRKAIRRMSSAVRDVADNHYDAIYVNSIASASLTDTARLPPGPLITHVHELDSSYELYGKAEIHKLFERTERFIVVSNAVEECLIRQYPEAAHRTIKVPEFIDDKRRLETREQAKTRLGLPPSAFVVGGSGSPIMRKGIDLFVRMAGSVVKKMGEQQVFFLWVGAREDSEATQWAMSDSKKMGLSGTIIFIPPQADPLPFYSAFDVFTMTSREDPFPIVNLEVGVLDVPVICFEGGGGSSELTGIDPLVMVPYLDTEAMADSVVRFLRDSELRAKCGAELAGRIRQDYTIEKNGREILAVLRDVVACDGVRGRTP